MSNIRSNQLTASQIDQLQQHLIVPLAVGDILHHELSIEPEMQYGLHLALSEVDPDSALLAIALCAQDIAAKIFKQVPIASALHLEAMHIIDDYAPTWLHHLITGPMPDNNYEVVLQTVPEDLEALADLLDAVCADLGEQESNIVILAQLLSIQARAHMEIADYMLEEIEYGRLCQIQTDNGEALPDKYLIDLDAHTGNNIIIFPGSKS